MKLIKASILLVVILLPGSSFLKGQEKYRTYDERTVFLQSLAGRYKTICSLSSVGKSYEGRDIRLITIGKGDRDSKPGIAIIGGVDSRYIAGSEIVTGFAARILDNSASPGIDSLLNEITFYLFPDINPDACNQFFASPRWEREGNGNPWDNDRDFRTDEDGFEDINGDGFITMMRVSDPAGSYTKSGKDQRVMKQADLSKGEKGEWKLYTEGIDNDDDGLFNEDGPGGVVFNNNFSYDYEEWGAEAGMNAMSENETRALADFLFDKYNIYAVITYGPDDNLGKPWKASARESAAPQRSQIVKSILKEDEVINSLVSDIFLSTTGLKGDPQSRRDMGNIAEWAYYHYGRYSFATPGWWIAPAKELSTEENYLKWASENGIEDSFVDWAPVVHPGFPGRTVEVGGIKPYYLYTPPVVMLDDIVQNNYNFIIKVSKLHPDPVLTNLKVEKIDKDIYRISLLLHNNSVFATTNELGDRNAWNRKMVISLEGDNDFGVISGKKREIIDRLGGDESRSYSWIIKGRGNITITAGAVNTGFAIINAELK